MKTKFRQGLALAACATIALTLGGYAPEARAGAGDAIVGGLGFLDKNVNGKRDAGEPTQFGWYKVTNGGSYFTCGFVGKGDTFGVTARPGMYYVMPIAVKGFHTTTPIIRIDAKDPGKSYKVEMGFAQDAFAPGDKCGQYEPKRVARQILYRRYLEQWVYDGPEAMRIEFDCPRGQEPKVIAIHSLNAAKP